MERTPHISPRRSLRSLEAGATPLNLYATLHRPLVAFPAANDDADPAVGGKLGLAIMLVVAMLLGALLATGIQ